MSERDELDGSWDLSMRLGIPIGLRQVRHATKDSEFMTVWRHASSRWRVHKYLVEQTGRVDDRSVIGLGRWNEVMQEGI